MILALSRGAGLPGLAAMPAQWSRDGLRWHRPLLRVPGAAIRDWLRERGETWVDDPSNADMRYTRNRIRARLLPVLDEVFPQFRETFPRSALHAAQAQGLLDEVAAQDLAALGVPPLIGGLQELSRARQANVLRHWLRVVHGTTPSTAQLDELLNQLADCTTRGHGLRLKVGRGHVRRRGALIDWEPA